jgi:alpha-tubulin suppressor-like RCC1 family protein
MRYRFLFFVLFFGTIFLGAENVQANMAGDGHTCAVKSGGTVFCWGSNYSGQLGDNSVANSSDETSVTTVQVRGVGGSGYLTGVSQVAAKGDHSCALKSDGSVFCWGSNSSGQLGDDSTDNRFVPVQVVGVGGSGYLTDVSQIAAGYSHTCALKSDNSVFCWGYNAEGELGNDSDVDSLVPVQVKGVGGSGNLSGVSQISAGNSHTCAVKSDGSVFCWGYNFEGELGNNSDVDSLTPVQVVGVDAIGFLAGVSQIEGGGYHTCALKSDNSVFCWGYGGSGELGNGDTADSLTPVQVVDVGGIGNLGGVSQLSVGESSSCAMKADGTIFCWGWNMDGQLGDDSTTDSSTPVQVVGVGGSGNFTGGIQLAVGGYHACAIKSDGSVFCWGDNGSDQLGDNSNADSSAPVQVRGVTLMVPFEDASQVVAGDGYSCALKSGAVYCWGLNSDGRLGNNTGLNMRVPRQVVGEGGIGMLTGVQQISAGKDHACALTVGGAVYCWGYNYRGQLGDNSTTMSIVPVRVKDVGGTDFLLDIKQVSAGYQYTCAAKTDDSVVCWGDNYFGQLGTGHSSNSTGISPYYSKIPVPVVGLPSSVTQVKAVSGHTCALESNGAVFCWGYNGSFGSLGIGYTTLDDTSLVPILALISGVEQISPNCAVKSDGSAFCWGGGMSGQPGYDHDLNDDYFSATPVQITDVVGGSNTYLQDASQISMGAGYSCATQGSGVVACWGEGSQGQLGDNYSTDSPIPVRVVGIGGSGVLNGMSQIAAGHQHACALGSGGTVFCWGNNFYGQIGDNFADSIYEGYVGRPAPVQVLTYELPTDYLNLGLTHALTYTAGPNGSISGDATQDVSDGDDGTAVTAVPDSGYHFVSWSDSSTQNPRTDTNVTDDINVTANFAINTYTLTYAAGANGIIDGTSPQTISYGGNGASVTAVPSDNYHFVSWSDSSRSGLRAR